MVQFLKNRRMNDVISAVVCLAMGLVLVIWPGLSVQVVCMALGGILLAYGLIQVGVYLFAREKTVFLHGMLLFGIILGVIGAWILWKPEMIIAAIPVIVGIIIVIHGVHNLLQAIELKRLNYDSWWVALFFALLTMVLGGVLVYNPFKVVNTVFRVIGAFLLYDGISDIWILSRVSRNRKERDNVIDAEAVEVEENGDEG